MEGRGEEERDKRMAAGWHAAMPPQWEGMNQNIREQEMGKTAPGFLRQGGVQAVRDRSLDTTFLRVFRTEYNNHVKKKEECDFRTSYSVSLQNEKKKGKEKEEKPIVPTGRTQEKVNPKKGGEGKGNRKKNMVSVSCKNRG
jgi:hypothetical protein